MFRGEPIPDLTADWYQRYWGSSVLQAAWDRLKNYGAGEQGVANLLLEFAVGKFTLKGLEDILASNNVEAIYNRLEIINASKSLLNSVILAEGESFTRDVVSMSGVPEVLDRMQMGLSAVSGIPVSRLFGKQSGGLNNDGSSEMRIYYDMINSEQEVYLRPPMRTLVRTVNAGLDQPIPEDELGFEFNPVWTPTQAELVDMQKKKADTDKIYVDIGVLSADEIRKSRFEGGFAFETSVEE